MREFSEEDRAETKNVLTEAKKSISFISKRMKMAEPHLFLLLHQFSVISGEILESRLISGSKISVQMSDICSAFPDLSDL